MMRRWAGARLRRLLRPTPADCGGRPQLYGGRPFVDEVSPDQARLDAWLAPRLGPTDRVLLVGIGTSALARDTSVEMDGLTLCPEEAAVAPKRAGYRVIVADKHLAFSEGRVCGPYTWILDNNPTSFACCRTHASALLDSYVAALAPHGRLLSDRAGLAYREGRGYPLGWAGWQAEGARRGMLVTRETAEVWSWRRAGR